MSESLFTIEELAAQVAALLSQSPSAQTSSRNREVPDSRTIRYYTTIGLLDRPALFRGRTALYIQRHLLQIIAIKRLQSSGLSLEEVQARLVGLPDKELQKIAGTAAQPKASTPQSEPPKAERPDFWKLPTSEEPEEAPPAPAEATLLPAIRLCEGATLILTAPKRPLTREDLTAITNAAATLLRALQERALLDTGVADE